MKSESGTLTHLGQAVVNADLINMIFLNAHIRRTKVMKIVEDVEVTKDSLTVKAAAHVITLISKDIVNNLGKLHS